MSRDKKRYIKRLQSDSIAGSRNYLNPVSLGLKYEKPLMFFYGDVRDVTLGGSPGGGDSGSPTTRRRR